LLSISALIESDAGVSRYTANALELAPTGGSAPTASQIADEVQTRTIAAVTNLTNLPSIPAGWLTAAGIAASALDGKGNWNVGKTGYSLTAGTGLGNQTADITGNLSGSVGSVSGAVGSISGVTFPANFGDLAITVTTGRVTVGTNADKTGYSITGTTTTLDALQTAQDAAHGAGSWATATGFSTHSAADVWAVGSRTLTAFGFTVTTANAADVTAILEDTNELQTDWANGGRLDLIIDTVAADVAGLDGAAMRGTDGAYTGTPPTAAAIRAEIDSNSTKLAAIQDRVSYCLTVLVGACADAGTAAETYTHTIGGETFTADYTGLDATGNRTTTTLSKV